MTLLVAVGMVLGLVVGVTAILVLFVWNQRRIGTLHEAQPLGEHWRELGVPELALAGAVLWHSRETDKLLSLDASRELVDEAGQVQARFWARPLARDEVQLGERTFGVLLPQNRARARFGGNPKNAVWIDPDGAVALEVAWRSTLRARTFSTSFEGHVYEFECNRWAMTVVAPVRRDGELVGAWRRPRGASLLRLLAFRADVPSEIRAVAFWLCNLS